MKFVQLAEESEEARFVFVDAVEAVVSASA
jgi:hypothetical protein